MIVSASYRTDIPAFYGDWFMRRLTAGYCRVVNPYGAPSYRVSLDRGAVDGFVFWTRNPAPFLDSLDEVRRTGFPFIVQMTITGYPRSLEASVLDTERALAAFRRLAERFGPRAVIWRYDPVLLTSITEVEWHIGNFAALATALRGATDEVILSFADFYAKTAARLRAAAKLDGFSWRDPAGEEKYALTKRFAAMAAENGMTLTLCAEPDLLGGGVGTARCIDAIRLSDVAGRAIAAREKGNRPGCACAGSRDIGAYDSCVQGCVYCYAVRSPAAARQRLKTHDADGEFLIAPD